VPRRPRYLLPDGFHHVTARGNRGAAIFSDACDRREFLALLEECLDRSGSRCHAYCLMTTHYHLLLEGTVASLSFGLHRLNGIHAQRFNRRHGLKGHLFEDRFYATAIESDGHLLEVCRYLALNPVRAGLCSAPAAWRWSSYASTVGLRAPDAFLDRSLLRLFSDDPRRAMARFASFVTDGLAA
jgi:putative transposase